MNKKFIKALIVLLSGLLFINVFALSANDIYKITIGNNSVKLSQPSFMYDNRIYVSLRDICEQLNIPVHWNSEKREANIDVYNKNVSVSDKTPLKNEGVLPDEQTALTVGKVILEKYSGKALEYETEDKIYFLRVDFLEQYNAWSIMQTFKFKNEEAGWAAGGGFYMPTVVLNKQNGEVISINTFSSLNDDPVGP